MRINMSNMFSDKIGNIYFAWDWQAYVSREMK
jgi:hypothetical protein